MRMILALLMFAALCSVAAAQPYGRPDRESPGDEMIQNSLARETRQIHARFLDDVKSLDDWRRLRPRYEDEYYYMLGLDPRPEKTPLEATVTGTVPGDGYVVEKLHYQSVPRLYVTANLYRPAEIKPGERLPAVLYVCGHSNMGRNGNKTAYQANGIWLARHGYICLVVDTLQLSEIAAIHHGTYREGRWWWQSRGYTPAGVECWNGVRGIDYLTGRPDVDPARIAVTGISGGGAATFWVAAADDRIKAAAPISGMSDLPAYVSNRVINGHCDCMFLYNAFEWPWARIAGLIAPRPLLFVNSDADAIFPMDGNERLINRFKRLYSLYGAGDRVDALVSVGGHAYRQDIRQGVYRFLNIHLKDDPRPVTDSEIDLVVNQDGMRRYPIPPESLRVFPTDADLPSDELNTTIDQHFVPMAQVAPPKAGEFDAWKKTLQDELRRVTFGCFPERVRAGKTIGPAEADIVTLETERGIRVPLRRAADLPPAKSARVVLLVADAEPGDELPAWVRQSGDAVYILQPRGIGPTRWTRRNPPNYVERALALLGRTADTGRVWDIIAAARYLRGQYDPSVPIVVAGENGAGVLAAYAALWEPEIAGVIAHRPPPTHMQEDAPQLLNCLRVCDIPAVFGMLAPRPVTITASPAAPWHITKAAFAAAGAAESLRLKAE